MNEIFFELIRISIGTQLSLSRQISSKEWSALYEMAKKQSLIGVCFAGVQKLCNSGTSDYCGMSVFQYRTWMGMAAKIQQRNEMVNRQCVELQKKLSADGFRSCILKGQSNLPYYVEIGMLRQSGDIDVWLEGGYHRIVEYVQRVSPTNEINQHHTRFNIYSNTEIELHFYPLQLNNPIKQRVLGKFCNSQLDKCMENRITLKDDIEINAATIDFNLVFQLMHIYHHLFTEGIGLRQLMDYYFILKSFSCSHLKAETDLVKNVVHELELDRFASALMWVINIVFVGHENSYFGIDANAEEGKYVLELIMEGGNFGHAKKRHKKHSHKGAMMDMVRHSAHLALHYGQEALWAPVWHVYHFFWKRTLGRN